MRGERANSKDQRFYLVGNLLPFLLFLISTKYSGSVLRRVVNVAEDRNPLGRPFRVDFLYKTWRAFFYIYIFNNFMSLLLCDETDRGKGGLDKGVRGRTKVYAEFCWEASCKTLAWLTRATGDWH
jgi:hypothetical protein